MTVLAALHHHGAGELLWILVLLIVIGFLAGALYVGVVLHRVAEAAVLAVIGVILAIFLL